MPSMRTEPLEREREPTRERILDAASRLFARSGFEATTIRDIARECELSYGSLYYHFDNKRAILDALLVEPPLERLALCCPRDATPAALVDDIARILDFWAERGSLLRLMYRRGLDGNPGSRAFGLQVRLAFEQLLMPGFEAIYGADARRIYDVVIALLTGIQIDALIEFGDDYEAGVSAPAFRARLRTLVSQALPPPHPAAMEAS